MAASAHFVGPNTYTDSFRGYTPLMIHWAVGGLWTNPLITSIIGLVPVYGKLHRAWRNAA